MRIPWCFEKVPRTKNKIPRYFMKIPWYFEKVPRTKSKIQGTKYFCSLSKYLFYNFPYTFLMPAILRIVANFKQFVALSAFLQSVKYMVIIIDMFFIT